MNESARQVIVPESKEAWLALRMGDVTSTEVSALFGLSPWCTRYELWHRKRSKMNVQIDENARMTWGKRLELPIAKGIAEDQKWAIRAMPEYIRDSELRMGASFDFRILSIATRQLAEILAANGGKVPENATINGANSDDDEILEIKNVDAIQFKTGWAVDENGVEAPPHIELQVQQELAVSGLKRARIGAFIGGNNPVIITRERDEKIIAAIKEKVAEFWKSIADNVEPTPDFEKDADFIKHLQGYAEAGKTVDASSDAAMLALALEYKRLGDVAKDAEKVRSGIKSQLLLAIGDAEKVIGDGFKISASMIAGGHVEYDKEPYRDFRVTWPKEKRK